MYVPHVFSYLLFICLLLSLSASALCCYSEELPILYYNNPPPNRGVVWKSHKTIQQFRSVALIKEETRSGTNELLGVAYRLHNQSATLKIVLVGFIAPNGRPAESVVSVPPRREKTIPHVNMKCKNVMIKNTN